MKKLIFMIPTEGKTQEQISKEAWEATQKYMKTEKRKNSQKNFLTSTLEALLKTILFAISWIAIGWITIKILELVVSFFS